MLDVATPEYSGDQAGAEDDRERNSPPPPPEVRPSRSGATLLWRAPSLTRTPPLLARHPVLCIATAASGSPATRRRDRRPWYRLRAAAIRVWPAASPRVDDLGSAPATYHPPGPRGEPVVVFVGGGRGGAGRTTLAVEVATALSASMAGAARRVLLVDADPIHSDLDVKLGVADLDVDRCPSARIDRVLLQLPELVDRRLHLDSLLWVHPQSGVRALLAPVRSTEIGREQLDYLYTYILAPAFDAIVVDAGPAWDSSSRQLAGSTAYWLRLADTVLLPLRPTVSDTRTAVEGIRTFEGMGVPTQRCRLVMGVDRTESATAAMCQRRLSEFVVVRWPWASEVARKAGLAHRPLAECDRRFSQSIVSLLPDLATSRRSGR